MIYLDNAATTQVAPEVLEAMMPYLTEQYGNAGALYGFGRTAADAIGQARKHVARLFDATPEHVVFTSGGSEGNNMVFKGLRHSLLKHNKRHLVVSAIEHDSVWKAARDITKDGFYITYVQPDSSGVITAKAVEAALRKDTGLVSVMFVNNETGAVNEVNEIGKLCRERDVLFHCDCVQAVYSGPLRVDNNCMDFATISAHKIHGPKGMGALYVRDRSLEPLICGGAEQEFGLRGGTANVAGIVGFGKAAELVYDRFLDDIMHVCILKQNYYSNLMDRLTKMDVSYKAVRVNGRSAVSSGSILNLRFAGVDAESLVLMLDAAGVCVSAGSACRSHAKEPSHVLKAMGLTDDEARSSIRVSFSRLNTTEEARKAAEDTAVCVKVLLTGA